MNSIGGTFFDIFIRHLFLLYQRQRKNSLAITNDRQKQVAINVFSFQVKQREGAKEKNHHLSDDQKIENLRLTRE